MLSAKDVTTDSEFLKVLVVGQPGTGKSVLASTFPTPGFVFDFSGGIIIYRGKDFDYNQYEISPVGWVKFENDFREVKQAVSEGKYQTVVLDDITAWIDIAMEKSMAMDPKRNAVGGPLWNVHYTMTKNLLEAKIRQLLSFNCNVILIAHMEVTKDDETGAVIDIKPLITGQLAIRLPGYFDEVYYTLTKKVGDIVEFMVQTVPIGMKNARSRLSGKERLLPNFIPNEYPALQAAIAAGKKKLQK